MRLKEIVSRVRSKHDTVIKGTPRNDEPEIDNA